MDHGDGNGDEQRGQHHQENDDREQHGFNSPSPRSGFVGCLVGGNSSLNSCHELMANGPAHRCPDGTIFRRVLVLGRQTGAGAAPIIAASNLRARIVSRRTMTARLTASMLGEAERPPRSRRSVRWPTRM
jgi:hypothetical protein